jgi:hypothetical protein
MKALRSLLIILTAFTLFAIPAAAQHPGGLLAVHGINGFDLGAAKNLPVGVAIDGACAVPNFRFGEAIGPVALDRGTYKIEISLPADGNCGGDVVISGNVRISAGQFTAIVAHVDEAGAPTASIFPVNANSPRQGFGRTYIAHMANAPKVDVTLSQPGRTNKGAVVTVKNGQARGLDLADSRLLARFYPTLSDTRVFGPAGFRNRPGKITLVYAVGTFPDTFSLIAQQIDAGPLE